MFLFFHNLQISLLVLTIKLFRDNIKYLLYLTKHCSTLLPNYKYKPNLFYYFFKSYDGLVQVW